MDLSGLQQSLGQSLGTLRIKAGQTISSGSVSGSGVPPPPSSTTGSPAAAALSSPLRYAVHQNAASGSCRGSNAQWKQRSACGACCLPAPPPSPAPALAKARHSLPPARADAALSDSRILLRFTVRLHVAASSSAKSLGAQLGAGLGKPGGSRKLRALLRPASRCRSPAGGGSACAAVPRGIS